jgi:hypothetical protein
MTVMIPLGPSGGKEAASVSRGRFRRRAERTFCGTRRILSPGAGTVRSSRDRPTGGDGQEAERGGTVGFNGDVVVFRGPAALPELDPAVGTARHPVYGRWAGADEWQAVHVRHFEEPYAYERTRLEAVAAATGGPVAVCHVFESDVAHLCGLSKSGYWEGWLDPVSTLVYLASRRMEELADAAGQDAYFVGGEFGDHRLYESLAEGLRSDLDRERPAVAEAVAAWAADAGYVVSAEDVVRQLERRKDPFVQDLFFELLELIGLDLRPAVGAQA